MKERAGQVFSIAADNAPVPGCTISKEVHPGAQDLDRSGENAVIYFSLAANTDISPEIYRAHKLLVVAAGTMEVYTPGEEPRTLAAGDAIVTKTNVPVGMRTQTSAIYTEINLGKAPTMNEAIKAGEVFKLAELLPYQEGKIVNMDVVHNDKMKFVLMSFDAGTGLSEHAAPGEAIIFALDGEGTIVYEGEEHTIKAGENFHFAKGGMHAVKAESQFKMALLLTLE